MTKFEYICYDFFQVLLEKKFLIGQMIFFLDQYKICFLSFEQTRDWWDAKDNIEEFGSVMFCYKNPYLREKSTKYLNIPLNRIVYNILEGLEMKAILKGSKEVRVKLLYIFNWSWTPKM